MGTSNALTAFDIFTGTTGALVASAAILRGTWTFWHRTIGRRRAFATRVTGLRIGMSTRYVVQTLGVPTFGSITERDRRDPFSEVRAVWTNRSGLIACAFDGGELWAFTIMSTDRWFRPRLEGLSQGQMQGRLGQRPFEAVVDMQPIRVSNDHGASTINYAEHYYFGRPGAYCDYALNASGFGSPSPWPLGFNVDQEPFAEEASDVTAYRRRARPNAVTVSSSNKGGGWAFNRVLMDQLEHVLLSPPGRRLQ